MHIVYKSEICCAIHHGCLDHDPAKSVRCGVASARPSARTRFSTLTVCRSDGGDLMLASAAAAAAADDDDAGGRTRALASHLVAL